MIKQMAMPILSLEATARYAAMNGICKDEADAKRHVSGQVPVYYEDCPHPGNQQSCASKHCLQRPRKIVLDTIILLGEANIEIVCLESIELIDEAEQGLFPLGGSEDPLNHHIVSEYSENAKK